MKWIYSTWSVVLIFLALGAQAALPSADAALAELKAGNSHHVSKNYQRPHQTAARQHALESGQSPHCAILTCADSRVPPEIIFDKGLGDIFDSAWPATSRETTRGQHRIHGRAPAHAAGRRHGTLDCGAVSAAVEGGTLPGKLPKLMAALRPAVDQSASEPGDRIANAVRDNVVHVVEQLRS